MARFQVTWGDSSPCNSETVEAFDDTDAISKVANMLYSDGADAGTLEMLEFRVELDAEADYDDPQCVCGTYRSEHSMLGCPEGFQTASSWEAEKEFIASLDEWEYERIYGDTR